MKSSTLRPSDLVIALVAATESSSTLVSLAAQTGRSLGEVHNALRRLQAGGLLLPNSRQVMTGPLLRFIQWGMPVAFPAQIGGITRGVATAFVAGDPSINNEATNEPVNAEFVWPHPAGQSRGQALYPLYPKAVDAALNNRRLRHLLALTDLVRIGGHREREAALVALEKALSPGSHP